jgi:hypothetical protein
LHTKILTKNNKKGLTRNYILVIIFQIREHYGGGGMTAKAEISRLLAIFNDLSENDKDIVLKISEAVIKPEIIPSILKQPGNKCFTGLSGEQEAREGFQG